MVRAFAVFALCALILATIPRTARSAADDEPVVRGKKASEWLDILRTDQNEKRRLVSLVALEIIGPGFKGVLPGLGTALKEDADERVRSRAAQLLGQMAAKAKDAKLELADTVTALTEALKEDKSNRVREAAAASLGRMGADARGAVPVLAAALTDKHVDTRTAAAESLGHLGTDAHDAVPPLLEVLKDKQADRFTRVQAAFALGQIGPEDAGATVPVLAGALADAATPLEVRKAAADALGQLKKDAKEAAPALGAALKEKDLTLRRAAVVALDRLGAEARAAFSALKQAAKDDDRAVRSQALHALGNLGKDDPDAVVPVLVEGLRDVVIEVRITAILALGGIGPEAKAAVPALTNAARDGQAAVREAAADALKHIQPPPAKPDK